MKFLIENLEFEISVDAMKWAWPFYIEWFDWGYEYKRWFLNTSLFCIHVDIRYWGKEETEDDDVTL